MGQSLISPRRSSILPLPESSSPKIRGLKNRHIPDETRCIIWPPPGNYPGVNVEACDSQKSRRAAYLADEYILNTDGSVNAVVATHYFCQGHSGLNQQILITSKQLFDFLSSAEARQQSQVQLEGSINRVRLGALKRRRSQTPPEHISSEDEGSSERERQSRLIGEGCL